MVKGVFLLKIVQTVSGSHPAAYRMGARVLFPGAKQPGHGAAST